MGSGFGAKAAASGLLGFGVVVGAGAYWMSARAVATAGAPGHIAFARPMAEPQPVALHRAPAAGAQSSPAPLLAEEFRDGGVAASAPAAPSAASVAAARARLKPRAPKEAIGLGPIVGGPGADAGSAASSAVASAAAAPTRRPVAGVLPAKLPARVAATSSVAAIVHYGSSDRSQMMERGAGPVYNFGSLGERADPIAGAIQQLGAVQQQVQAADVPADQKASVGAAIDQADAVAYQAAQAAAQAAVPAAAPSR